MIPILIFSVGLLVLIGWVFGIGFLVSLHPDFVSMKPITAFLFMLSSIMTWGLKWKRTRYLDIVISACAFGILFHVLTLLYLHLTGHSFLFQEIFQLEAQGTPFTISPNEPSIMTTISFALIGCIGVLALFDLNSRTKYFALIVSTIGWVALLGYILHMPILYYATAKTTAMALPTAILFVLLGHSLYCRYSKSCESNYNNRRNGYQPRVLN